MTYSFDSLPGCRLASEQITSCSVKCIPVARSVVALPRLPSCSPQLPAGLRVRKRNAAQGRSLDTHSKMLLEGTWRWASTENSTHSMETQDLNHRFSRGRLKWWTCKHRSLRQPASTDSWDLPRLLLLLTSTPPRIYIHVVFARKKSFAATVRDPAKAHLHWAKERRKKLKLLATANCGTRRGLNQQGWNASKSRSHQSKQDIS